LQLVSDAQRPQPLRRLSYGRCDADNPDRVIEELIAFFLHGMTAPAPSKSKRHRNRAREQTTPPEPRKKIRWTKSSRCTA
jgi:hypothetical protein